MKLRILQWNVWFQESAQRILDTLQDIDADVICLQELTRHSMTNPGVDIPDLIAQLGYHAYYQPTIERAEITMGNAIFSKFPIMSKRATFVQHEDLTSLNFFTENRIFIEIDIQTPTGIYTFGTIHLSDAFDEATFRAKNIEAEKFYQAIQSKTKRFIMAGDLNVTPDAPLVQNLQHVFQNIDPALTQPSWTFKYTQDHSNARSADQPDMRMDYIFATHDVKLISTEFITTDVSDHTPILTTISLAED